MRWRGQRESENVEDRRGQGGGFGFPFPGGGMRFPSGGGGRGGGIGIVGFLIILGLMLFFGLDPSTIIQSGPSGDGRNFPDIRLPESRPGTTNSPGTGADRPISRPETGSADDLKQFISVVLANTEDVWENLLGSYGRRYNDPTLVLFSGAVRSACGTGMAAMGPFYCPSDEKVYIDLSFFEELKSRFLAPGDFAQAYVIAHEIGHHVQKLLGIADQVEAARQRLSKEAANSLQVRMELQADCFAGIWAKRAGQRDNIIEPGDIDEALGAASAIGDDRIQRQTQGYVVPDSFTHGSSAQRVAWFRKGYESGDLDDCDSFNTDEL
ncbi:MAG: KPN_02809 family neutral zinc metallopeptidase [Methyloceanibacter sp.]|uniref:KPN_02809 family neutral zinc metallopeptidase n=1 Tax=Methyloceanibacter sp. TaxID=1965321 RepID=UPI003D9BEBE9